jgi:hypothetical protein
VSCRIVSVVRIDVGGIAARGVTWHEFVEPNLG